MCVHVCSARVFVHVFVKILNVCLETERVSGGLNENAKEKWKKNKKLEKKRKKREE